jgi:deazaflavin-dependent oxidoreductase (nitroreductase family)
MTPESIKTFNKTIADEFRANDGKVGGQFEGADLLLLTTTGAKSGQPRVSPLAYFRIDGKLLIIGSFAGADVNPAWVHNLRANPSAHVEFGTDSSDVTAVNCRPPNATSSSLR